MISLSDSFRRLVLCGGLWLFAVAPVQSELLWSRNTNGTWLWSDAANWTDGEVPAFPEESEAILFSHGARVLRVEFDLPGTAQRQVLTGGLRVHGTSVSPGTLTFDLQGHTLVFDGGALVMSVAGGGEVGNPERKLLAIEDGTVQIGTDERTASLELGRSFGETNFVEHTMSFHTGATLDTHRTEQIRVAAEPSGNARNYHLDLSAATLRSGERLQTLATTGDLLVGQHLGEKPSLDRHVHGRMSLGEVQLIEVGRDLVIAERGLGTNGSLVETTGTVAVAANASPVVLTVGRHWKIGVGDRATGVLSGATGQAWAITMGSEADPAGVLWIGYKNQPGSTGVMGETEGSFVSGGGSFDAYLSELVIGRNALAGGSVLGRLDLSEATLGRLEISGNAVIGEGHDASGHLYLKGGEAASTDLRVGVSTEGSPTSRLALDGTLWKVGGHLQVGGSGIVDIEIYETSAGIDLASDDPLHLVLEAGSRVEVGFHHEAGSQPLWGLRMEGNQVGFLQGLRTANLLVADGAYGGMAAVFADENYTYFGLAAIPEPSALLLLVPACGWLLLARGGRWYRRAGAAKRPKIA